jgi:hypothetical protein
MRREGGIGEEEISDGGIRGGKIVEGDITEGGFEGIFLFLSLSLKISHATCCCNVKRR